LSEQRGRVVLLTFWATWCGPCRQELPELVALRRELGPKGFDVVAVSIDGAKTVGELPEAARKLGLDFPVAHSPAVASRFGVSAIPALRLIGRDGTLAYSAKGYSADALRRLREAVELALREDGQGGGVLGRPHGVAEARLLGLAPLTSGTGVVAAGDRLAVGIPGASPWVEGPAGASVPDLSEGAGSPDERLAWQGGPVAVDPGRYLLRAWDDDGALRWTTTLASAAVDVVTLGEQILVAAEGGTYVFDAEGRLLQELPGRYIDLAAASGGGAWAIDGEARYRLRAGPAGVEVEPAGAARGAARVAERGELGAAIAVDLVSGRVGPGGAPRVVATRTDHRLIGLDGAGAPAFSLELRQTARLAAADLDGDGQDELIAVIRGVGVARIHLRLP
jgi:thiol-disulfide isomerase/thioredoxin